MAKYIVAFIVVLGLAVYIARQDESSTNNAATKTAAPDKQATAAKPDENHSQQNVGNPEGNGPSWYGFFRWPTGTTTWAIILTLLAIAEQTNQTAKAAKASEESTSATRDSAKATQQNVDLQKAAYRQWLKIENWEANSPGILGETGLGIVFVSFDVRNPTEFPLNVRKISIKENGAGMSPTPFELNTNRFMPPSDKFQFQVQVFTDKEVVEGYHTNKGKIFITVIGSITFSDVLGDTQVQDIGQYCILNQSGNEFFPQQLRAPVPQDEQERESKNPS